MTLLWYMDLMKEREREIGIRTGVAEMVVVALMVFDFCSQ